MSGAKLGASWVRDQLAVVEQVRWSLTSQRLVDKSDQLIVDPLLHRKPVQATKNWWDVVASASSGQKARRRFLDRLQTLKQTVTDAVKQRITVIQTAGYERLDYVFWQIPLAVIEPPDATDGADNNRPGITQWLGRTSLVDCRSQHQDHVRCQRFWRSTTALGHSWCWFYQYGSCVPTTWPASWTSWDVADLSSSVHRRRQHIRPGDQQPAQRHRPMSSHRLDNRPRTSAAPWQAMTLFKSAVYRTKRREPETDLCGAANCTWRMDDSWPL